jgi:hypothetical protein
MPAELPKSREHHPHGELCDRLGAGSRGSDHGDARSLCCLDVNSVCTGAVFPDDQKVWRGLDDSPRDLVVSRDDCVHTRDHLLELFGCERSVSVRQHDRVP